MSENTGSSFPSRSSRRLFESIGPVRQARTKRFVKALLKCATPRSGLHLKKGVIKLDSQGQRHTLIVKVEKSGRPSLARLVKEVNLTEDELPLLNSEESAQYKRGRDFNENCVTESIKYLEHFLEILTHSLERTQGQQSYEFILKLWSEDINRNLIEFDRLWKKKRRSLGNINTEIQSFIDTTTERPSIGTSHPKITDEISISQMIPYGPLSVDCPFYIKRFCQGSEQTFLEDYCNSIVLRRPSVLCVKGPELMGKSSFMLRLLEYAKQFDSRTAWLDFREANFTDGLDGFLFWFCQEVAQQLELRVTPEQYLNFSGNSVRGFQEYFINHVLCTGSSTKQEHLLLGLDSADRTFPYPSIARPFWSLLRAQHEKGKHPTTLGNIWKNLSLVITHSTDVYIDLGQQSAFNIAEHVELPELILEQVEILRDLHSVDLNKAQLKQLMDMVGGHPHLLRLAMYNLRAKEIPLPKLLQEAPTDSGIYKDHLHRLLEKCRKQNLEEAICFVMSSEAPVTLDTFEKEILKGIGLIKFCTDNKVIPSCELYRSYFSKLSGGM